MRGRNKYPPTGLSANKSCFAKELKQLDEIAVDEKSLLDQLSARVKSNQTMTNEQLDVVNRHKTGGLTMPSERRKEVQATRQ